MLLGPPSLLPRSADVNRSHEGRAGLRHHSVVAALGGLSLQLLNLSLVLVLLTASGRANGALLPTGTVDVVTPFGPAAGGRALQASTACRSGDVRLTSHAGYSPPLAGPSGLLEVLYDGVWGTVCCKCLQERGMVALLATRAGAPPFAGERGRYAA